jgi:hypothetical protein
MHAVLCWVSAEACCCTFTFAHICYGQSQTGCYVWSFAPLLQHAVDTFLPVCLPGLKPQCLPGAGWGLSHRARQEQALTSFFSVCMACTLNACGFRLRLAGHI